MRLLLTLIVTCFALLARSDWIRPLATYPLRWSTSNMQQRNDVESLPLTVKLIERGRTRQMFRQGKARLDLQVGNAGMVLKSDSHCSQIPAAQWWKPDFFCLVDVEIAPPLSDLSTLPGGFVLHLEGIRGKRMKITQKKCILPDSSKELNIQDRRCDNFNVETQP
ncbi:MAG: hypothetical protein M1833_000255 [Piccolia ochrophora]|nr:MAG: hypothetical protein M1833_000255 [Piccolia ochrophora]